MASYRGDGQRDPGIENQLFSILVFPTSLGQLEHLSSYSARPLFAALNFLPHQRKWGEPSGAATAIGAMVSP